MEIRSGIRVAGCFPDGNPTLIMICAWPRHVADTQWGSKKTGARFDSIIGLRVKEEKNRRAITA